MVFLELASQSEPRENVEPYAAGGVTMVSPGRRMLAMGRLHASGEWNGQGGSAMLSN